MSALLSLQVCTKLYKAFSICAYFLLYCFLVMQKVRLDSEHFAVYHGARCLYHLLRLVNMGRVLETETTSALVALSSRNTYTSSSSFESVGSSIIFINASANSRVDVCSVHVLVVKL